MFKFDHNILSRIAFAVLNFLFLWVYYLFWMGHWITNKISLYVCTLNAFPKGSSYQLFYYSNFLLFFYFRWVWGWVYTVFFLFLDYLFCFPPLFLFDLFLDIYNYSYSSNYYFECTCFLIIIFYYYDVCVYYYFYTYLYDPFLLCSSFFVIVQNTLPFWVLTNVVNHPQKMVSICSPSSKELNRIFRGLLTKFAEDEPNCPD